MSPRSLCTPRWLGMLALTVVVAGCGGPLTISQRLVGEWVGRPEVTAERVLREWPSQRVGLEVDANDPEVATAIAKTPTTDLEEEAPGVEVRLRLEAAGDAELSLAGQPSYSGAWSLTPIDARRAYLDLEARPADAAAESPADRRRFEVELLRTGEGFTLREAGADRRFGRLLFRRPAGSAAPVQTASAD